MGALGQQAEHIFRADDGEQEGFWIAVDGRHEQMPARFEHGGAGADHRRRVGYMLKHLQASHHIVLARVFRVLRQLFYSDLTVVHLNAAFHTMESGDG